jgi:hypothetical protein
MAKKTKQEKIRAAQRRLNQTSRIEVNRDSSTDTQKNSISTKSSSSSYVNSEEQIIRSHFLADFKKSVILISTILLIEVLLYQASIHGYLTIFSAH